MTTQTITLELPDMLAQQLRKKQVDEKEIKAIALAALEMWLAQTGEQATTDVRSKGRFSESAVPFTRRLISQNRELFAADRKSVV